MTYTAALAEYTRECRRSRREEAHARALQRDLLSRCVPDGDCLIWTGATSDGYGVISSLSCNFKVHRLTYEQRHGPIPDGLEGHHTCEVKACCNPDHVEPKTGQRHMEEDGRLTALAAQAASAARIRWHGEPSQK